MWSARISHPHSNTLVGMEIKMRYLMQLLMLASVQNLAGVPIDNFPAARHVSMS